MLSGASTVDFYGEHQAGIATPAQDRLLFGSFDVTSAKRSDLVDLLHEWTAASATLTTGDEIGRNNVDAAPPDDTGEALGLAAARLTITFGFGPTLFELDGDDRFGIAARRPAPLIDLPRFAHDNLDPARSGGDIGVQVCADDPQVAFHALRNLTRIGKGLRRVAVDAARFRAHVEHERQPGDAPQPHGVQGRHQQRRRRRHCAHGRRRCGSVPRDAPAWMRGGSYLVSRRIKMRIEQWDRDFLGDQEDIIGRVKSTGAPLGAHHERDIVDLAAKNGDGTPVIPADAHIRLAAPATNGGAHLLRRGYSFTDGVNPVTAGLDAGLFFLAYMRDPRKQFVPIQTGWRTNDALNEYIEHNSSAIFAVPPGVEHGGYIGGTLFAA